ncbi:MAG: right-handed parallel beta-helix repeat-containing protein, partial [Acidobacteriia bacterium]|nr:right-handed parallel beta-helix repeat-containing protein [Terriglobia bacterium]
VEVGALDTRGYANGVAVSGTTAYLADGPYGLRVIDVSKSSQPVEVGSAYVMNYAFGVTVDGRYAYIAAAGAGLLIADIGDARQPVEVGSVRTGGYAYGVAVVGNVAYVADGWEGVKSVNVADRAHPYQVGSYKTPGWAFAVTASWTTAWVADAFGGLRVLDVSDPAGPVEMQRAEMPGGHAGKVVVDGDVAYVADRYRGLRVLSLSGVSGPKQVGSYEPLGYADAVAIAGNYAYVAAAGYGLRIVDISDPAQPRQVGALNIPGYSTSVAVDGTWVYVANVAMTQPGGLLYVVDASDPAHPVVAASLANEGPRDMAVADGIAYFPTEHGLEIVSVADPPHPVHLSYLQMEHGPYSFDTAVGITVRGTLAYVASSYAGLVIVDVADPRAPMVVGAYGDAMTFSQDVVVAGNMAYVADLRRLLVVDVSDPAHPSKTAAYDLAGDVYGVTVAGSLAYVAGGSKGLHVLDVSSPSSPRLVGSFNTQGYSHDAAVASQRVYVADGSNGLLILERMPGDSGKSLAAGFLENGTSEPAVTLDRRVPLRGPRTKAGEPPAPPLRPRGAASRGRPAPTVQWTGREASARPADRGPAPRASGACVVASTADAGAGTLRQCLQDSAGGDTITFDSAVFPPSAPATIAASSPLPELSRGGTTIDASNAGVILDGSKLPGMATGLSIVSDNNVVKGLQILRFSAFGVSIHKAKNNQVGGDSTRGSGPRGEGNVISRNGLQGVYIEGAGADGNVVIGNLLGTDSSGTAAAGNLHSGASVDDGARGNRIGGTTPGERNIISGNLADGITFSGAVTGNVVIGNFIGTDVTGAKAVPNQLLGVILMSGPTNNRIGGTDPGERNIVSGNSVGGVALNGSATGGNWIVGNYVGTDPSGALAVPNAGDGINTNLGAFNNLVQGNLSSGNGRYGINFSDWGTNYNVAVGNRVGTDAAGTSVIPNHGGGVALGYGGAQFNRVGGTRAEDRNLVIGSVGVGGQMGTGNLVLGNWIGTDITGQRSLGLPGEGVGLSGDTHSMVGGATPQEANMIASSGYMAIRVSSDYNYVAGNYIGTDAGGELRMSNGGSGVSVLDGEHNIIQGNIVTATTKKGTPMSGPGSGINANPGGSNTFRRNSIYGNEGMGIEYNRSLTGTGTSLVMAAPVIATVAASSVTGTACAGCEVEIFSDSEDEGRVIEGSTLADAAGAFRFAKASPLAGPNVTATATDRQGNTSEFSAPRVVGK